MTDELSDMALEAIEKARKTGKIKKGANEAIKAIEKGIAKLVVVAKDVNPPEIIMPFKPLCAEKENPACYSCNKRRARRCQQD